MKKALILLLPMFLLISCVTKSNMGQFTAISTKMINSNKFDLTTAKATDNVVGTDTAFNVLFFEMARPRLNAAVNSTLANGQGDLLLNAKAVYESRFYFLFNTSTIRLTGTVVDTKTAKTVNDINVIKKGK